MPILVFLLLALLLATGIALVWQHQQEKGKKPEHSSSSSSSLPAVIESNSPAPGTSESTSSSASSSQDASSSESETTGGVPASQVVFGEPVPQSGRVKSEYFDDALFIGDSISEGIELYQMMDNATVLANKGLNPETIFTKKAAKDAAGNEVTVIEALKSYQPKKVYVMLGANGLGWIDKDKFISYYGKLIDEIKSAYPGISVYIQSILPVTANFEKKKPEITNAKIDEYNAAIRALTKDKQVYYVNVAESFKNDAGALPDEASPKDGMHFGADYYQKWFDYLKTHVVTEE
ncbi:GDSL-type esterase/lipase family protein [Zongyangia hominis]|uniref:SGNH hydrolase-type esterase domain-containing protein n=1 Tax=Zongyangia hominis TaxID=2763677 RepID=A0A926ECZ7_9FIRM|nr:GDSL-type esterase/lipase family protein [Zongyangia hominis]MBC8569856.1 hypothetical protein [Zongyangia hominis]